MCHLENPQWYRPVGGSTRRRFLSFGGPVFADRISHCPLDRVLTHKNLIYLLNLQYYTSLFKLTLIKFVTYMGTLPVHYLSKLCVYILPYKVIEL